MTDPTPKSAGMSDARVKELEIWLRGLNITLAIEARELLAEVQRLKEDADGLRAALTKIANCHLAQLSAEEAYEKACEMDTDDNARFEAACSQSRWSAEIALAALRASEPGERR